MTHTPAPWSEGMDGNSRVYGPDGMGEHSGLVANVFKGRGNVKLIAAAPDLLAVVKMAANWFGELGNDDGAQGLLDDLRAAIAKAEGGA